MVTSNQAYWEQVYRGYNKPADTTTMTIAERLNQQPGWGIAGRGAGYLPPSANLWQGTVLDSLAGTPGLTHAPGAFRGVAPEQTLAPVEQPVVQDLQYWLDQARGQNNTDWAGMRQNYEDIAAKAQNRIASMYRALKRERQQAADVTNTNRDAAEASIQNATDAAVQDITDAYNSAYGEQARVAAMLGLENPLSNQAMTGMADSSAHQRALSEQIGQQFVDTNATNRASDLAYNQDMIGAAGFGSNEARANIESLLMNRLADLYAGQQQQNSLSNLLPLAQGLQQLNQATQPAGLSFSDQLKLDEIAYNRQNDARQAQDAMLQFLMDKKGMDYQTAADVVNQYYANQ